MPSDDLLDFLDPPAVEVAADPVHVGFERVSTPDQQPNGTARRQAALNRPGSPAANRRHTLFFDLETAPDYSRADLFGLDAIPAPAQRVPLDQCPAVADTMKGTEKEIKDRIKGIAFPAEYLAECANYEATAESRGAKGRKGVYDHFTMLLAECQNESANIAAAAEELRKTMSLTPEFCRIISFAWAVNNDPTMSMVVGDKTPDGKGIVTERDVLVKFWELAKHAGSVVGYNILNFDLPVVFVRSILLDVDPSRRFDMKPWGTDVCDVFAKRFPKGSPKDGGVGRLKNLAPLMGIKVDAAVDDVDGGVVGKLYEAGDYAKVGQYNRSDVDLTKAVHSMYDGFFV